MVQVSSQTAVNQEEAAALLRQVNQPDLFKRLGVEPDADDAEIRTAFRNLVREFHPDSAKNSDLVKAANEAMPYLTEAKNTLLDPEAREKYLSSRLSPSLSRFRNQHQQENPHTPNVFESAREALLCVRRAQGLDPSSEQDLIMSISRAVHLTGHFVQHCPQTPQKTEAVSSIVKEMLSNPRLDDGFKALWEQLDRSDAGREVKREMMGRPDVQRSVGLYVKGKLEAGRYDDAVQCGPFAHQGCVADLIKRVGCRGQGNLKVQCDELRSLVRQIPTECRSEILQDQRLISAVRRQAVPLLLNQHPGAKYFLNTFQDKVMTARELSSEPKALRQNLRDAARAEKISMFDVACLAHGPVEVPAKGDRGVRRAAIKLAERLVQEERTKLARAVINLYDVGRHHLGSTSPLVTEGVVRGPIGTLKKLFS